MTPRLSVSRTIQPSFSKVDTDVEVEHYRREFCRLCGARDTGTFPGCNPCSIGREDLRKLWSCEYLITLKSDGVRFALFLTTRPGDDGGPVALLIDRSWNMFEIEVVAPEAYFLKRTVLEGEIVWQQPDEQCLVYLVFDALVVKGENLRNTPFVQRLESANRCTRLSNDLSMTESIEERTVETDSIAVVHYSPKIVMRPKHFVSLKHARRLWNERDAADHRVDGLVMNRADAVYNFGTAREGAMYKWKPQSTVDLSLRPEDGAPCSYDGPLPDQIHGRRPVVLESRVRPQSDEVVEYLVEVKPTVVNFFPLRKRPDKGTANSERVVCATVRDVIEDVSVEELGRSTAPSD